MKWGNILNTTTGLISFGNLIEVSMDSLVLQNHVYFLRCRVTDDVFVKSLHAI